MKKSVWIVIGVLVALGVIGGGAYYLYLVSPTKGPTQPAGQQPPMGGNRPQPKPMATAEPPIADAVTTTQGQTLYKIIPDQSTATFTLNEILYGQPKTVVGTSTAFIAGNIGVDKANFASSTIGTVKLNARTFVTDSEQRNNTIRRMILKTEDDANQFITFSPTSIAALPADFGNEDEFWMDITGDLTISGVTKSETFRTMAKIDSETGTITIHAATTLKRGDFNLVIPNFSFLANVDEEVKLTLDLVAQPEGTQ